MTRFLQIALATALAMLLGPGTATAQRIYLGSEYTTCSTPFKPASGVTSHAGKYWDVTWKTTFGQFAHAVYVGSPNPVISTDGKSKWSTPTADVDCLID